MSREETSLTPGTVFADRYRLQLLHSEGSRQSWEALDEIEGRTVLVELLHPDLVREPVARERFFREGEAVERIASRHVAEVLTRGIEGGRPYLVFPRYEGETLAERLCAKTPLDVAEVAEVVRQSAIGLEAAHEAGVVHRDVEPSNLLLVPERNGVVVKVRRFALAALEQREKGRRLTKPGQLIGAPPYLSPERIRAKAPHPTDDLWSLAVVAYQALTRRVPFEGDTFGATYVAIVQGRFLPPSELRSDLPGEVDAFFQQAFTGRRQSRFLDAAAFSRAFRQSLGLDSIDLARARERLGRRIANRGRTSVRPPPLADASTHRTRLTVALTLTHAAALGLGLLLAQLL